LESKGFIAALKALRHPNAKFLAKSEIFQRPIMPYAKKGDADLTDGCRLSSGSGVPNPALVKGFGADDAVGCD